MGKKLIFALERYHGRHDGERRGTADAARESHASPRPEWLGSPQYREDCNQQQDGDEDLPGEPRKNGHQE